MALVAWGIRRIFVIRVSRFVCHGCRHALGKKAALAAPEFYERLYGSGVEVFEYPPCYNGARVVACHHCGAESVFSEYGQFIETFDEQQAFRERIDKK